VEPGADLYAVEKGTNPLSLSGIEMRFLSRPARSLVTILTELSRLQINRKFKLSKVMRN
jgi:hypothetical protein